MSLFICQPWRHRLRYVSWLYARTLSNMSSIHSWLHVVIVALAQQWIYMCPIMAFNQVKISLFIYFSKVAASGFNKIVSKPSCSNSNFCLYQQSRVSSQIASLQTITQNMEICNAIVTLWEQMRFHWRSCLYRSYVGYHRSCFSKAP